MTVEVNMQLQSAQAFLVLEEGSNENVGSVLEQSDNLNMRISSTVSVCEY